MKLLHFRKHEHAALRITPDSSVRNWRTEDITRSVADSFKIPIDRISRAGGGVQIESAYIFAYEMVFEQGEVRFFFHTPNTIAPVYLRRLQSVWPDSTVEQVAEPTPLNADKTAVHELVYKRHDMYSLHTDAKDNAPLQSILEAGRLLAEGERARVFALFEPLHQATWRNEMEMRWEKLREGHTSKKWDSSIRNLVTIGTVGVATCLKEVVTAVSDIIGNGNENMYKDKPIDPLATQYAMEQLTMATRKKAQAPAIKTYLWAACESNDKTRADMISRTLAASFGDLGADNELTPRPLRGKKKTQAIDSMRKKTLPIGLSHNILSASEAGKVVQVPGRELQESYSEIVTLQSKQVEISNAVTKEGMPLGEVTYRGLTQTVYIPITKDPKTWDEGCLPAVAIAGMGQGKSTLGANYVVEFVRMGFGAAVIDPAKGLVGNDIAKHLPPEKIMRIKLGRVPFSLDFREVKHGVKSKNRLANVIVSFFEDASDTAGAQTKRFIKAAAHAMQGDKLKEILRIFEDGEYRRQVVAKMPDGLHKSTLNEFDGYQEKRQRQILAPIYNRFDVILGDDYLEECFESEEGIDMVELLQQRKAIVFDVPKTDVGAEGLDIIVNLLMAKLDLAMTLRPEENQFPFAFVLDEPAQYLKSAGLWKSAAVESRKWRVKYVWLFHEWVQLPVDLRRIIKAAGPHYHIYRTSFDILHDLKREIHPFTEDDGLKLKRFHAINIIQAGGGTVQPFIAYMCPWAK